MSTTDYLNVSLGVDPKVVEEGLEMNRTKKKGSARVSRRRKTSGVVAGVDLVKRKRRGKDN